MRVDREILKWVQVGMNWGDYINYIIICNCKQQIHKFHNYLYSSRWHLTINNKKDLVSLYLYQTLTFLYTKVTLLLMSLIKVTFGNFFGRVTFGA